MKQREAVYQSVVGSLNAAGIEFQGGQDVRPLLTTEIRKDVSRRIAELFTSGAAQFKDTEANKAKLADAARLNSYIAGLITNWVNKDPNLNGGIKYETKNPGVRAGGSDPMLKEMRLLKKQLQESGNDEGVAKVEAAIAERVEHIKASKNPAPREIDIDSLPDFLKDLVV